MPCIAAFRSSVPTVVVLPLAMPLPLEHMLCACPFTNGKIKKTAKKRKRHFIDCTYWTPSRCSAPPNMLDGTTEVNARTPPLVNEKSIEEEAAEMRETQTRPHPARYRNMAKPNWRH